MKVNSLSRVFLAVAGLTLAGCGGDAAEETPPAGAAPVAEETPPAVESSMAVIIETPANDELLTEPNVEVSLRVVGVEIAPVAEGRAGTAHHHLFLDVELTPFTEMVPLDDPRIVHMGDGRTSHTFEALEPGPHRVIAVLADLAHIPLDPLVADTVTFRVGG
jgi:hypothetical protein